jgi:predicted RNA-binding Zn-ribbon protein involved in translation (DUF1610 family)
MVYRPGGAEDYPFITPETIGKFLQCPACGVEDHITAFTQIKFAQAIECPNCGEQLDAEDYIPRIELKRQPYLGGLRPIYLKDV